MDDKRSPAEMIMAPEGDGLFLTLKSPCSPRGHKVEGHTRTTSAIEVAKVQADLHAVLLEECRRLRAAFVALLTPEPEAPKAVKWICASCGGIGPEGPQMPPRFKFAYLRSRGAGFVRRILCNSPRCARAFGGFHASPTGDVGEGN